MKKPPVGKGLAQFLPENKTQPLNPKMAIHPDKAAAQKTAWRSPAIQAVEKRLNGGANTAYDDLTEAMRRRAAATGAPSGANTAYDDLTEAMRRQAAATGAPSGASAAEGAAAEGFAAKAAPGNPAWSRSTAMPEAAAAESAASRGMARALPAAGKALGLAAQFAVPYAEIGGGDMYKKVDNLPVQIYHDGTMRSYEPNKPTFRMQTPAEERAPTSPVVQAQRPSPTPAAQSSKLNTSSSIVDFMKSRGANSDYASRAKMAKHLGIEDYTGSAQQNIQMLKSLQSRQAEPETTPQRMQQEQYQSPSQYVTEPETTPQRMRREQPVEMLRGNVPSGMPPKQYLPAPPPVNLPQNDPRRTTNYTEARFNPAPQLKLEAPLRRQSQQPAAAEAPEVQRIRKALAPHEPYFGTAGKSAGVDEDLLRAMAYHESRGKSGAVSPKGAGGVMQLMPATFKSVGGTDINDPADNIGAGARYMAQMMKRYNNNIELALAAYNAGPGRVKSQIPEIKETKNYVNRVVATYRALKGETEQI